VKKKKKKKKKKKQDEKLLGGISDGILWVREMRGGGGDYLTQEYIRLKFVLSGVRGWVWVLWAREVKGLLSG